MTGTRPLVDNLFVEGPPPRILGSRCRETGQIFYPVQNMNPVTHKTGTMELYEFAGSGKLLNYATIHRGIPGFESPLALGVIRLDEGPILTAQLADWSDGALRIGQRVEMIIGRIKHDPDGTAVMGPKFRPIAGDAR